MTSLFTLAILAAFAMLAAIFAYSKQLKIKPTDEIIQSLHPRVLERLEPFLDVTFEDDKEFWFLSGGYTGMRARRHNAQVLLQLFQDLVRRQMVAASEIAFLSGRANLIVFFCFVALAESVVHRLLTNAPHISARIVAILYSQMQARVKTLAAEYSPLTLHELDTVL